MTIDNSDNKSALAWLTPTVVWKIVVGYVVVAVVYGFVVYYGTGSWAQAGLFGDTFGAFNAFFSGLAMLGIVGAILLQREQNRMQAEELKLQRQELADTREELRGQKEALITQNQHAQRQAEAAHEQIARWDKDYIERNKPVVFCDRWENGDAFGYSLRNVGGGFAVNVYFINADNPLSTPLALGSIASNSQQELPTKLNETLVDAKIAGLRHILIAEGPHTRTSQWTPTLNFRTSENDIRKGHVQHRVARVVKASSAGEPELLRLFLDRNVESLLEQLRTFGTSASD